MTLILRPLIPPEPLISSTAIMMALCVDWPNVACAPVSEPYSPMRMSPPLLAAFPPPPPPTSVLGGQPASKTAAMIVNNFRNLGLMTAIHCKEWAHILQLLEGNTIADPDRPALNNLSENAGAPVGAQRFLHFFHEFAGRVLPANVDEALAELQFLAT